VAYGPTRSNRELGLAQHRVGSFDDVFAASGSVPPSCRRWYWSLYRPSLVPAEQSTAVRTCFGVGVILNVDAQRRSSALLRGTVSNMLGVGDRAVFRAVLKKTPLGKRFTEKTKAML